MTDWVIHWVIMDLILLCYDYPLGRFVVCLFGKCSPIICVVVFRRLIDGTFPFPFMYVFNGLPLSVEFKALWMSLFRSYLHAHN